MAVLDIQRRMRELGRIRLGKKSDRGAPQRLETFRLTSPSKGLIEHAARLYGGEVEPWDGAPDGVQWQVITTSSEIPIAIPPTDEPWTQHYELWSGAGCQRRCDGRTVTVPHGQGMRERDCLCDPDERECKLTTRAVVMLHEVPGIGVWRIESHGYNAAVELTGALDFLARQAAQGVWIEAVLRLDQRSKREPGKPVSRFVVPVIETPSVSIGQIMSGQASMPRAVEAPRGRPALPPAASLPPDPGFSDPEPARPTGTPGWGATPEPPRGAAARRGNKAGEDTRPSSLASGREQTGLLTPAAGVEDTGVNPASSGARVPPVEPEAPSTSEAPPAAEDTFPMTEGQRRKLFALANEKGIERDTVRQIAKFVLGHGLSEASTEEYERMERSIERYAEGGEEAQRKLAQWVLGLEAEGAAA